eukprot:TRINITY_DN3990_c0_g1_i1.p1 TRINITY_DN3990_c0_g1~~TRINITY_DN3990_c0_g1_i1.p1  ORF type:complete len:414 (-),score=85.61 TRINITY_DN3990_c0_g1_i1:76-1317(-)
MQQNQPVFGELPPQYNPGSVMYVPSFAYLPPPYQANTPMMVPIYMVPASQGGHDQYGYDPFRQQHAHMEANENQPLLYPQLYEMKELSPSQPPSNSKSVPQKTRPSKDEPTVFATSPIRSTPKPLDPSVEAFSIQQKKCKKCAKFYKEDENAFDACKFHPGHYKALYTSRMAVGSYIAYSCCKASSRSAAGCKIGRHLECETTTAAMKQFAEAAEAARSESGRRLSSSGTAEENLIDLQFDESSNLSREEQYAKAIENFRRKKSYSSLTELADTQNQLVNSQEGTQQFFKHNVNFTDTLSGLSLRYDIPVDEIKSVNKLIRDEDLWTRFQLLIPYRGQEIPQVNEKEREKFKADMKGRLIKRFRRTHAGTTDAEAKYYLKANSWNLEEATKEFKDDKEWEKTNPPRQPLSRKC